ncbi:MAG: sigma-E factor negative regulatory protein [Pseudomonadota bacterium]
MTGTHDSFSAGAAPSPEFHRERLSAMLDGALSADETRFLLRRMQHDDELADCWERWQFYGDAMRGHAGRALPADFSQRVGRAIADDIAAEEAAPLRATSGARRPLLRWGGGAALAASVALAALFVGRDVADGGPAPTTVASAPISAPEPTPALPTGMPIPQPVGSSGAAEPVAATAVAAVAAASATRRPRMLAADQAVDERRTNPLAGTSRQVPQTIAGNVEVASATGTVDAASIAPGATISAKPWPRSLVPGASASGEVTAGFGAFGGGEPVGGFRAGTLPPVFQPNPERRFEPPQVPATDGTATAP